MQKIVLPIGFSPANDFRTSASLTIATSGLSAVSPSLKSRPLFSGMPERRKRARRHDREQRAAARCVRSRCSGIRSMKYEPVAGVGQVSRRHRRRADGDDAGQRRDLATGSRRRTCCFPAPSGPRSPSSPARSPVETPSRRCAAPSRLLISRPAPVEKHDRQRDLGDDEHSARAHGASARSPTACRPA